MLILTIRTDKPEAELGLFDGKNKMDYEVWQAHRELSSTIHLRIEELLKRQARALQNIEGIVAFKGPGSFTGLRIGLTVANALAYSLSVPIVAKEDPNWLEGGIAELLSGRDEKIVVPEYGAPVHITKPKH